MRLDLIDYLPPPFISYSHIISSLYPKPAKQITFQVTEDCCLKCSYCYQNHKTHNKMTFDTAKIFIDKLLNDEIEFYKKDEMSTVIFEFIGGEPLLEIQLISNILDYTINQMIKIHHPWLTLFRCSLCSNGVLYFTPEVQKFFYKFYPWCSFSISIDGNKELHDSCRVDFDGNGSYDRAIAAVKDYEKKYRHLPENKMTIAPDNVSYLYEAVINLINLGYTKIPLNCVYENVWQDEKYADILYNELIKLADYIIDNDLYNQIFIALFDKNLIHPFPLDINTLNEGMCGGTRPSMLSLDYKGEIYTCIRFMESSLNGKQKPLPIGNIYDGLLSNDEYKKNYHLLTDDIDQTERAKQCITCPIGGRCKWCSGYCYEEFGEPKQRTTYTCEMYKAQVRANKYYWDKLFKKLNIKEEQNDDRTQ